MKPGDTVRYSHPQNGEESFRFNLLHVEKGKADIQLVSDWAIQPIETVAETEIEPATISQSDFFNLATVKALQDIQKANPYGSKPHREAWLGICAIAKAYGVERHFNPSDY